MAVQHILYISSTRLKRDTALGESIDANLIMPYILLAQDMHILPILGQKLHATLTGHISAGTLTSYNETLVEDYIQPCLVQFAFTELLPYLRLRFVNNAIVVMGATEQSSPATYEDLRPIMDTATNAAEFYRERAINYIKDNIGQFPDYNTNVGSDLSPTTENYYTGLNLSPKRPMSNKLKSFLQGANITTYGC